MTLGQVAEVEALVASFSYAIGFGLALILFAGVRERILLARVPKPLQDTAIALVTAGQKIAYVTDTTYTAANVDKVVSLAAGADRRSDHRFDFFKHGPAHRPGRRGVLRGRPFRRGFPVSCPPNAPRAASSISKSPSLPS